MSLRPPLEVIRETIPAVAQRAVFAGGCFWCLEANFQIREGVLGVINGYAGGTEFKPTYEDVYLQKTSHREAVLVYFKASQITYATLLQIFWQNIDPTDNGGQFADRGLAYTPAIFYRDGAQKELAEASLAELQTSQAFEQPITVPILPYTTFYEAEAYHQNFFEHYPERYQNYTQASGREDYKRRVWQAILKEKKLFK